jgi:hypothetical protein
MLMKHLFAAAAVAPLCFAAATAFGQTTISVKTNPPLVTSTAGNIDVGASGTIDTLVAGPAITVDSNNTISIEGQVLVRDQANATGVLVQGDAAGRASSFTMAAGVLRADDSFTNTDTNHDGNLDGPFVPGPALRYGLRVTGPGTFTGDITQTGGIIAIEGNGASAAVSIETPVVGNLALTGQIGTLGTGSFGVVTTAPISGNVTIGGILGTIGEDATGVSIGGDVGGKLLFNGSVSVTGFRYPTRPTVQKTVDKLGADDLLIGGPGIRISNSVAKGVWFYQTIGDNDPNSTDEDGDGLDDTTETGAFEILASGSAPAIIIGGASNIVLGNTNTTLTATNYGLILGGSITASGVYDKISAQAVIIGGQGGTVNTSNGIRVEGSISSAAIFADSTALHLEKGAIAPLLTVDGTISAGALGSATSNSPLPDPTLRALVIDVGASVPTLMNTGIIRAGLNGTFGNLTAVSDASGTLNSITNEGTISAVITTGSTDIAGVGKTVALDLSANTTGVEVLQQQNTVTTGAIAPVMTGDVLFGSGNANLQILAGSLVGFVAFGSGTNILNVADGATISGGLSNTGTLTATVDGVLAITSAEKVPLASLTTGNNSTLLFTVDPKAGASAATELIVSGQTILGPGSAIAVGFRSKLSTPAGGVTNLVLIDAAGGLTNKGFVSSLDGKLPYIYDGQLSQVGNQLLLAVSRRSAADMGLTGSPANAFNAFYDNFDKDPSVTNIVLSKTTQGGFNGIYNQFLPDYSGGPFNSMASGVRAVQRNQAEEPADMNAGEPRSWLQEVGFGVNQTSNTAEVGYQTAGFAVAAGYEQPAGKLGTVGYSLAILTSDVSNNSRAFGSKLSASSLAGSFYWRKAAGGLVMDASATGAYAWFDSQRRIVDVGVGGSQNLVRTADANWYGAMGGLRLGAAYEAKLGSFYIRPEASVDYLYLYENGYKENGGGASIDLTVDSRSSSNSTAEVGLVVGGRFGRTFHWGPELTVAYRTTLAGSLGTTTANFTATPADRFGLTALPIDKQRLLVRLALRGSGAYANFALEGSGEFGNMYDEYTGRLVVRFIF